MINLAFTRGSSMRKVNIDGNTISMMSQETGFLPMKMDLDKLDDSKVLKKMDGSQRKEVEEISKLASEDEKARDIIRDFQQSGWRCIKKE